MNTLKKGLKRAAYEFGVPLSEVRDVIQELLTNAITALTRKYMTDGGRFVLTVKSQLLSS